MSVELVICLFGVIAIMAVAAALPAPLKKQAPSPKPAVTPWGTASKIYITESSQRTQALIHQHMKTLVIKAFHGLKQDDYGNWVDAGYYKDMRYFYDKVVGRDKSQSHPSWEKFVKIFEAEKEQLPYEIMEKWLRVEAQEICSGTEFEHFVAQEVSGFGWSIQHTGKSGDQGADVIARKDGRVVVIQCKWYSSPVGNKAVQEAHAAKGHYRADGAAVVSNASFTKAAAELAQSIGVLLLHPAELNELDAVWQA